MGIGRNWNCSFLKLPEGGSDSDPDLVPSPQRFRVFLRTDGVLSYPPWVWGELLPAHSIGMEAV